MSVYRIEARRHTHPRLGGEVLTEATVNWLLPDAHVMELDDDRRQFLTLRLGLQRADYPQGVNEIVVALQQAGYSLINAEVSELVDHSVRAMVGSALTMGGGTAAATKKPIATILMAALAAVAAREVESRMRKFEVVYRFNVSPAGVIPEPVAF